MMSAIEIDSITASGMPVAYFLEQQIPWAGSDPICQENSKQNLILTLYNI